MKSSRRIAVTVGVLFIIGTVAGILSVVFSNPLLGGPDYLLNVGSHPFRFSLGALFILVMGLALAMIPVVIYPVLKRHDEILALGYVVFRGAIEAVTYLVTVTSWLLLVVISRAYLAEGSPDMPYFRDLGNLLLKAGDIGAATTSIVFPLGAMMLYAAFYRSRLVPRWLSVWGLAGVVLTLAVSGLGGMLGITSFMSPVQTVTAFPIFLQEMVMAVWLIVKGFNPVKEDI